MPIKMTKLYSIILLALMVAGTTTDAVKRLIHDDVGPTVQGNQQGEASSSRAPAPPTVQGNQPGEAPATPTGGKSASKKDSGEGWGAFDTEIALAAL